MRAWAISEITPQATIAKLGRVIARNRPESIHRPDSSRHPWKHAPHAPSQIAVPPMIAPTPPKRPPARPSARPPSISHRALKITHSTSLVLMAQSRGRRSTRESEKDLLYFRDYGIEATVSSAQTQLSWQVGRSQ